ncbi:MAG: hypothetical protein LBI57_00465 [Helicobacteraceae bacterium]|jgi:hypothetical protein|nr:hypothetical protein [Helicobacteraceae bacterium]
MKKKIQEAIGLAEELVKRKNATAEELERLDRRAKYFQNERLVHLITTAFVGLADMIALAVFVIAANYAALALLAALSALFLAYIAHYYALENGVQKLCDLIDKLRDR